MKTAFTRATNYFTMTVPAKEGWLFIQSHPVRKGEEYLLDFKLFHSSRPHMDISAVPVAHHEVLAADEDQQTSLTIRALYDNAIASPHDETYVYIIFRDKVMGEGAPHYGHVPSREFVARFNALRNGEANDPG